MYNLLARIVGKLGHECLRIISHLFPERGRVYMLHDISNKQSNFSISHSELEQFLLSVDNSKIIKLSDWEYKSNFIAITIDDVPESFFLNGFPLFKKYGVPFTIFVNTSLLDTSGYITTEQLKELSLWQLCTIGSHGTYHDFYKDFSKEEKINFLEDSQKILSEICGRPVEMFAFPYGSLYACGFKNKKLVSRFYKYGFGTIATPITYKSLFSKYFLPRINLDKKNIYHV